MKETKYIFDMDGTLYTFDKGKSDSFTSSRFYTDLKGHVYKFFMERRDLDQPQAIAEYDRIKTKYKGEVSLGVEAEYGIDRYEYFDATWGMQNPQDYLDKDPDLQLLLMGMSERSAILTSAPRVWTLKVLAFLNIGGIFGNNIYTGEPNLRKPDPEVFKYVADRFLKVPYGQILSVGDQEESDIIPAKKVGMRTVKIGITDTTADFNAKDIKDALRMLKEEGLV
jgi:HAD superfamily hydrolase (TIGR01549 family)